MLGVISDELFLFEFMLLVLFHHHVDELLDVFAFGKVCFSCEAKGDIIALCMQLFNLDFLAAIEYITGEKTETKTKSKAAISSALIPSIFSKFSGCLNEFKGSFSFPGSVQFSQ